MEIRRGETDEFLASAVMRNGAGDVAHAVGELGATWRATRAERQARRHLDTADFRALRDAGLLCVIAPVETGGRWVDAATSFRPLCGIYRALAGADSSVALVSSMHPSVIAFWLATADPGQPAWEQQRRAVFASATAGVQWGTITSEPGSGGDIARTKARATPIDGELELPGMPYAISGDKHFGSGFGITDWMITSAIPDGEDEPALFALDVRGRPWDGTSGYTLLAEWDGVGMAATQSHAMRLESAPAVRLAWDGPLQTLSANAGPLIMTLFTAVVLGVLDEAVELARAQVAARDGSLRAYEQVEWARADQDHWLAEQAFDGALRAIECGDAASALHAAARAKQAIADLAEDTMRRLSRVLGGGTFSRRSPFAFWFEDVRALGFLRPPWGLAYDSLYATSL